VHLALALPSKANDLGKWHGVGRGCRSAPLVAAKSIVLDRGPSDEARPGAVRLRIDVELAGAGEERGAAEGDLELTGGGGELHRPAVEGLDALVLGS
jgi:hypothetical protein